MVYGGAQTAFSWLVEGSSWVAGFWGGQFKRDETKEGFWVGRYIAEDGDYVDLMFMAPNVSANREDGAALEFNVIDVRGRPNSGEWFDGFSIGIGLGSASDERVSPPVPGVPISPSISIENIRRSFEGWYETAASRIREILPENPIPTVGGGQRP
jgi:hypothetical protein